MIECMTFPDTVEEFMDSYMIVDTEHVYTNGTPMVPIYRMRQWFEHEPEIVQCKDCRHRGEKPIADGRYWCNIHNAFMYYCSDAERTTEYGKE